MALVSSSNFREVLRSLVSGHLVRNSSLLIGRREVPIHTFCGFTVGNTLEVLGIPQLESPRDPHATPPQLTFLHQLSLASFWDCELG